jgi:two-component system, cell cycle sensor histidine kinase and response regulator CckA
MSSSHAPALLSVPQRERRDVTVWSCILGGLVLVYGASLSALHFAVGNPAFLLGLVICLLAAVGLGIRGALIVVISVALVDRGLALSLPRTAETGAVAGVISLLVKLLLAGGLGWVLDSRRYVNALNAKLHSEIAAREDVEQSLRRSEAMQRALVDSLGEGVGLFDARDRVIYANQALAETLGVPRAELEAKTFGEFLTEHSAQQVSARPEVSERRSYEVVLERSRETLLLVTETRFGTNALQKELALRVVRDLTERVLTERRQRDLEIELQRSQALQSLAVMAGGVAHDFNNLLCGVVGNAQLARLKVPSHAPPLLSRCLDEIMAFAEEAAQLSKQMLAYAGRRSLAISALDINEELAKALRLLHGTVDSKARLILELPEGLPLVGADCFQLRQVLTNLVLNALDAMSGQRGTLTLRTELARLAPPLTAQYGLAAGDYVKVTVSDTGGGIDPEIRERLFEPFFSTKGSGRGMGLAAAAGIVRAHGGWLGVVETSNHGTSFGVLFPVAGPALPRPFTAPVSARGSRAARNVLLIDDEPAVRLVTGRMLTELGHHVVTAETGRRGVELLQERPESFDLVLLDLTMPEQSGEQTLAELRVVRDNVPVVITSGFQANDASTLLQLPAVIGFLDKPHTLSNLEMLLASVDQNSTLKKAPGSAITNVSTH